jgi:hypothetical protein
MLPGALVNSATSSNLRQMASRSAPTNTTTFTGRACAVSLQYRHAEPPGGPVTGPEHFRVAEPLLAEAGEQPGEASARTIATAQVHATLAPAATALHGVTDHRHWFEAMGSQYTDG